MEESARRYARRVLMMHLLVLAVAVLLVVGAGRTIYDSARQQALAAVQKRQALLANQTARGIESFYESILSDLDLLQRAENEGDPATRPAGLGGALGRRGMLLARPLWRQLEGRASHLFVFDKRTGTYHIVGERAGATSLDEVVAKTAAWLNTVDRKMISSFQQFGQTGVNLVCIPADPRANRVLAAVVPVKKIEDTFLGRINADPTLGATLLDDGYRAMATSKRELIGVNMLDATPPEHRARIQSHAAAGEPFQLRFEDGTTVMGLQLPPAILAIEPINLPNKRWWIYMALPMSDIDQSVRNVFGRAMVWAGLVIVLVTTILVSTSVQMIRGRIRVERIRHEILTKELEQARKIQLAWLPQASRRNTRLDIAARNEPASHISGDFYDWFDLPDGRLVVTIGDVTGHGMAAAFLMATTQLLVRTTIQRETDPGKCLEEINRQLCLQVFNGQFVTMLMIVIDPAEQTMDLATAGHMPPLVVDEQGIRPLPMEPQLVMGVESAADYPTERFALASGSLLILYTDGVVDTFAPDGRRFGNKGLESLAGRYHSAKHLLDAVVAAVNAFRGSGQLTDDLTLVTVQATTQTADLLTKPSSSSG